MTPNNNFSVVPFYKDIREQDFRKPWAYGEKFPLIVDSKYFIPCFFKVNSTDIVSVKLFDCCGVEVTSGWTNTFEIASSYYKGINVVNYANKEMNLPLGQYYFEIVVESSFGEETYYSEVFTSVANIDDYLKIYWFCEEDIDYSGGYIPYKDTDFVNCVYLKTDIGMPEYKFDEEGEERDGYFFASKQLSEKKYKFNFYAPEYLCDAMRTIRMSDDVKVVDVLGREYLCDTFLMDANWLEQGHYAEVNCEVETDTIVKMIGKGLIEREQGLSTPQSEYEVGRSAETISLTLEGNLRGIKINTPSWITFVEAPDFLVAENDTGLERRGIISLENAFGDKVDVLVIQSPFEAFIGGDEPFIPSGDDPSIPLDPSLPIGEIGG